jgi:hypothetical protein
MAAALSLASPGEELDFRLPAEQFLRNQQSEIYHPVVGVSTAEGISAEGISAPKEFRRPPGPGKAFAKKHPA